MSMKKKGTKRECENQGKDARDIGQKKKGDPKNEKMETQKVTRTAKEKGNSGRRPKDGGRKKGAPQDRKGGRLRENIHLAVAGERKKWKEQRTKGRKKRGGSERGTFQKEKKRKKLKKRGEVLRSSLQAAQGKRGLGRKKRW